eukprot:9382386-Pyramimonas_sp.AAC.1
MCIANLLKHCGGDQVPGCIPVGNFDAFHVFGSGIDDSEEREICWFEVGTWILLEFDKAIKLHRRIWQRLQDGSW